MSRVKFDLFRIIRTKQHNGEVQRRQITIHTSNFRPSAATQLGGFVNEGIFLNTDHDNKTISHFT
jgi:hypothetical protein